jgi:hypothetical protein
MTATEQLKQQVDTLPEPLAREVLVFLLTVARRHGIEPGTGGSASLRGVLRRHATPEGRQLETDAWQKAL